MTKYYHMIIQRRYDRAGETRREYISTRQGTAPQGWVCVGVGGYHEKEVNNMKLIKALTAIILTEIIIAIPILVGIYVWSMVAFV